MCRRTHARRKLRHDATKLTKLTQEEKLKVPHACKYQSPSYTPGSAHVAAGLSESADPGWPGPSAWGSEQGEGSRVSGYLSLGED